MKSLRNDAERVAGRKGGESCARVVNRSRIIEAGLFVRGPRTVVMTTKKKMFRSDRLHVTVGGNRKQYFGSSSSMVHPSDFGMNEHSSSTVSCAVFTAYSTGSNTRPICSSRSNLEFFL